MLSGRQIIESILKGKYKTILKEISKEKLFDIVLKSGDARLIYKIALDFNDIDKNNFSKAIASTENIKYIILFAKNIKGANLDVLASAVSLYGTCKDIRLFASDIKDAPIDILEDAIISTNSPKEILNSLLYMKKANKDLLINTLIKINDVDCLMEALIYTRKLTNSQTIKLLNLVILGGKLIAFLERLIYSKNYKKFFQYIEYANKYIELGDLVKLFNQIDINNLLDDYKIKYIELIYKYNLSKYIDIRIDSSNTQRHAKSRIREKKGDNNEK